MSVKSQILEFFMGKRPLGEMLERFTKKGDKQQAAVREVGKVMNILT